jgi:YVTN family beta-propeller protein
VPIYLRGVHYDGIIDYETGTVVATIDVGLSPFGVDVTPDGSNVYVTNLNNTVSVIDTATNAVSATISVGNGPVGVAFTPDGSEASTHEGDTRCVLSPTASSTAPLPSRMTASGVKAKPLAPRRRRRLCYFGAAFV